jgi:hypothetical protein
MSDEDFENTDAPDNDFAFEMASHVPIIFRNPHAEDCPLSVKENWRLVRGVVVPKPGFTCACVKSVPVRDVPVWIEPKEVDEMPIYQADGEDDEGEPQPPTEDEPKPFDLTSSGGWMSPHDVAYPLLDIPEVTARRGGMSFTFPSDPYNGLGKKELRARLKERDERIREYGNIRAKDARRVRKLERKVRRLLAIVERLAGK